MLLSRIIILLFYITCINQSIAASSENSINEIPSTYLDNANNNTLWTRLLKNCKKPSMSCIQNNVYQYFDDTFATKNVTITSFLSLTKNQIDYETINDTSDESEARSSPVTALEDVADALRDKAYKFMFTHDVEFGLPEMFGGGVLKISPRSMEGSGALLKVDIEPSPQQKESTEASPRIFIKKIKKFVGNKLIMALMAILVVIKLLSVKFMFFLPMIMGVAAAKKLLLKVLLFLIPGLAHLFKLCPYYAPTKYHHHHHQIAHLHQLPHGPNIHNVHGIELDHPPPGWHEHHDDNNFNYYSEGPGVASDFYDGVPMMPQLDELELPAYEALEIHKLKASMSQNTFVSHRKNYIETSKTGIDENAVGSGYGVSGQGQMTVGQRGQAAKPPMKKGPLTPTEIENMVLKAEKEAMLKGRLQEEQKRVEIENKRLQDQIKNAMKIHEKLKIQSMIAKQSSKIAAVYQQQAQAQAQALQNPQHPQVIHQPPQIIHAVSSQGHYLQPQGQQSYIQQHVLQNVPPQHHIYPQQNYQAAPAAHAAPAAPVTSPPLSPVYNAQSKALTSYDPFYSPILEKIDKVLLELGFSDEPCRERLICSMYKNPAQYSPHSNLVSAELSRDADELQKPVTSNTAVIRFYKYVQAARDGQDKRECLRLYQSCTITTE